MLCHFATCQWLFLSIVLIFLVDLLIFLNDKKNLQSHQFDEKLNIYFPQTNDNCLSKVTTAHTSYMQSTFILSDTNC